MVLANPEEKQWGMLAHVIPFGVTLLSSFGWVAALVIYLIYKDKSRFVAFHALQHLLFMGAIWFLVVVVGGFLAITIVGLVLAIPLWVVCGLMSLIFPIVAALKANEGQVYEMPIVGRFARNSVGI